MNPMYWWGATAVASPIIIHLINRLRYRRIRWAAMEFLLKSQQRNRRKLIIEQLLLLAMRCLIVFFLALLVIRPTWGLADPAARKAELPTHHVVVLDDTLSMQDLEQPGQERQTAFREATRIVGELARRYAESPNAHYFTVLRLSNLQVPEMGRPVDQLQGLPPGQQLTDSEVRTLRNKLEALECSYLPAHPLKGVKEANRYLENVKPEEGNKVLHLVSDFRRIDWAEVDSDELCQLLAEMAHSGKVQVRLHDVAHPGRTANRQEVPRSHPNLGLTNLVARARSLGGAGGKTSADDLPVRVVTPNIPVYLHATLKNFSDTERTALRLSVRIDGIEKPEFSRIVDRISGGEEKVVEFDIRFAPEEKLGLKQVSVQIDDPEKKDHLPADNVRYTYLELQKEIPVLLVDPDHAAISEGTAPDSFYIANALTGPRSGLAVEKVRPSDLKKIENLNRYPVIFLLNVAGVGTGVSEMDEESLQALENYVFRGGSVVFFLSFRVNADNYNKFLYKNGAGIFPVPLMLRPDPASSHYYVDEQPDEKDTDAKMRFLKEHPAFRLVRGDLLTIVTTRSTVNRYFKIDPNWQPTENVSTIIQLANRRPLTAYVPEADALVRELNRDTSRFRDPLRGHAEKIQKALENPLEKRARKGELIAAVEGLLGDPRLAEYWADPSKERQLFKERVRRFREILVTGDPLVLEATVGQGKVKGHATVFLTSAGPTPTGRNYNWNNWANELFFFYVPMLLDLHGHMAALSRAATDLEVNRLIGTPAEIRLDKEHYDPRMQVWFFKEGQTELIKADEVNGREEGGEVIFTVTPTRGPGFYQVRFNAKPEDGSYTPRGPEETRPLAFNVDNRVEGSLSRIGENEIREKLAAGLNRGSSKVAMPEAQEFVEKHMATLFDLTPGQSSGQELVRNRSWPEFSFVLLAFFVMLALESWMATKFSHHVKGGELTAPPQALRGITRQVPQSHEPVAAEAVPR
jgi:hypothetical protein